MCHPKSYQRECRFDVYLKEIISERIASLRKPLKILQIKRKNNKRTNMNNFFLVY